MEQEKRAPDRARIALLIEQLDTGEGGRFDFDDFLYEKFKDKELDSICLLCGLLPYTHPPESRNEYCSETGMEALRAVARRLRAEASESNIS